MFSYQDYTTLLNLDTTFFRLANTEIKTSVLSGNTLEILYLFTIDTPIESLSSFE